MQKSAFVFSGRWQYKLARHAAFWVCSFAAFAFVGVGGPAFIGTLTHNSFVEYTLVPALYLPGQALLVYAVLYFVIPRYVLTSKFKKGVWWLLLFIVLATTASAFIYAALIDPIRMAYMNVTWLRLQSAVWHENLPAGFIFSFRAVIAVAGFAAAIKLMKYWYEKEYINSMLQKEKLDAELQLLKAQLHPHFLFNTLNNIYSITENVSPLASGILLKLSGLLRYMLYECNQPAVRLAQECSMIEDYIQLEKIRYEYIDISAHFPPNMDGHYVAPLLLLPLVENCFKHGASKMLEQPWININFDIKDNTLAVKIINGKPAAEASYAAHEGIGLRNIKKRLGLLYPGKHSLAILSEADVFIVNLKFELTAANGQAG